MTNTATEIKGWLLLKLYGKKLPAPDAVELWKLIDKENHKPENKVRCDYIEAWLEAINIIHDKNAEWNRHLSSPREWIIRKLYDRRFSLTIKETLQDIIKDEVTSGKARHDYVEAWLEAIEEIDKKEAAHEKPA